MAPGQEDMTPAEDAVRELYPSVPAGGFSPIIFQEMNETPDSVEIGQSAKGGTYIKSVKIYYATDATPEEVADRVKGIFDAVNERLHPGDSPERIG